MRTLLIFLAMAPLCRVEAQLPVPGLRLSKRQPTKGGMFLQTECKRPTTDEPAAGTPATGDWKEYYECRTHEAEVAANTPAPEGFFKIRTQAQGEAFWKAHGVQSLTSASVFIDNHKIGTTLELASGVVFPVFGSATITGAGSDPGAGPNSSTPGAQSTSGQTPTPSEQPAVGRMLQGGGTLALNAAYPWMYYSNEDGGLAAVGLVRLTGGGDAPALNSLNQNASGLFLGTAEVSGHAVSDTFGFEGGISWQYALSNEAYAQNLGLEGRDGNITNGRIGVVILRRTRLGFLMPIHAAGGLRHAGHFMVYAQELAGF